MGLAALRHTATANKTVWGSGQRYCSLFSRHGALQPREWLWGKGLVGPQARPVAVTAHLQVWHCLSVSAARDGAAWSSASSLRAGRNGLGQSRGNGRDAARQRAVRAARGAHPCRFLLHRHLLSALLRPAGRQGAAQRRNEVGLIAYRRRGWAHTLTTLNRSCGT